jgi:hypothetical protein
VDEAARQDATLAAAEAPLPQYFAIDEESSSDDEDFRPAPEPVFRVCRSHDDKAGGSTLPVQREADAGSVPAVPRVAEGDPRGYPSAAGGSEVADTTAPDVDFTDVHLHVWLPWSALPAVRTSATSATYHYRATC